MPPYQIPGSIHKPSFGPGGQPASQQPFPPGKYPNNYPEFTRARLGGTMNYQGRSSFFSSNFLTTTIVHLIFLFPLRLRPVSCMTPSGTNLLSLAGVPLQVYLRDVAEAILLQHRRLNFGTGNFLESSLRTDLNGARASPPT